MHIKCIDLVKIKIYNKEISKSSFKNIWGGEEVVRIE